MDASKLISGGATGAGLGPALVYVAGRFGAHLTSEDGALACAAAIAVGAFVAHNGIRGVFRIFWRGSGNSPAPPSP